LDQRCIVITHQYSGVGTADETATSGHFGLPSLLNSIPQVLFVEARKVNP
jgi:hypothetical protein